MVTWYITWVILVCYKHTKFYETLLSYFCVVGPCVFLCSFVNTNLSCFTCVTRFRYSTITRRDWWYCIATITCQWRSSQLIILKVHTQSACVLVFFTVMAKRSKFLYYYFASCSCLRLSHLLIWVYPSSFEILFCGNKMEGFRYINWDVLVYESSEKFYFVAKTVKKKNWQYEFQIVYISVRNTILVGLRNQSSYE